MNEEFSHSRYDAHFRYEKSRHHYHEELDAHQDLKKSTIYFMSSYWIENLTVLS